MALILHMLDNDETQYQMYRAQAYRRDSIFVPTLLDSILANSNGRERYNKWVSAQDTNTISLVCGMVDKEMAKLQAASTNTTMESLTPKDIERWKIDMLDEQTPVLTKILRRAAQSNRAEKKNQSKSPDKV